MKNSQKGSVGVTALIVIIIALIGGGIYFYQQNKAPQTDSGFVAGKTDPYNSDGQPTKEYTDDVRAYSANGEIKMSFQSFWAFADDHKSINPESLCKGGFINTDESGLMNIADRIVKNRILNLNPLEYAKTQDEAGITCVASSGKWVLFSALNTHSKNDGKNFYCIDSSGENGNVNFDIGNVECLK
jgi:hypothetical protein